MPPRLKKLIGLAILLPALAAYCLAAMVVADFVPNHQLLKAAYFLVAGIAWAFPIKYLIRWTEAEPRSPGRPNQTDCAKSGQ